MHDGLACGDRELALLAGAEAAFARGDLATAEISASLVLAAASILPSEVRGLKGGAAWNLACIYTLAGDATAALEMIDIVLADSPPDHLRALEYRAGLLLALGQWREGWPLKARNARWNVPQPGVHIPMWRGEPSPATIFVYQVPPHAGFGDVLAYLRFLPLLRDRGYDVEFRCMTPLVSLVTRSLRGSGVTVAAVEQPADATYALPLFGLAAAFAIEPHTIPPPLRLRPDKALVAKYKGRLPRYVVGLCWASGPQHPAVKPTKSIALAAMEPIYSRFPCVSLQVGPERSQLAGTGVLDVLPANPPTFEATAALASLCRAIVSVDTSVVHLAGGLGVPTHVPLHPAANPFFLADVEGAHWQHVCPWYPQTHRVYRRPADGDCRDVIARIAAALAA
jgi:hypothetical protein